MSLAADANSGLTKPEAAGGGWNGRGELPGSPILLVTNWAAVLTQEIC